MMIGSLAAAWHARIGIITAGGIFAILQSMGALGTLKGPMGIGVTVAGVGAYGAYKWVTRPTPEQRLEKFLRSLLADQKKRDRFWGNIDL